VMMIEQTKHDQ